MLDNRCVHGISHGACSSAQGSCWEQHSIGCATGVEVSLVRCDHPVVKVPSVEAEDHRHLHRDLETLKQERASTMTRIEGLLSSQGLRVPSLTTLPEQLEALRLWD